VECQECGIIFIDPQPTVEEIARMYSKEYFEGDFRCGHAGSYFDESTLNSLADRLLIDRIKQIKPTGNFLEVGCAGGAFLSAARDAGYHVNGVEYSAEAATFARTHFGLEVWTGDLTGAAYPDNSFDVVFMGDVLEHLPDPVTTIREIGRVLNPGGLLVIECPMQTNTLFSRVGFIVYSVLGRKTTVHLPPYHLFEYRPASMKYLLQRCSFDVTFLNQSTIQPREVTLRGPWAARVGKKLFQYPNYWVTSALGIFGDRIEVFASRQDRDKE
jgi:SAM-dependent methyltransferase